MATQSRVFRLVFYLTVLAHPFLSAAAHSETQVVSAPRALPGNTTSSLASAIASTNQTAGLGSWSSASSQANDFVSKLSLAEKAYMVTGVNGPCVGNIAPIPRLGFGGLCLQDGALAIRQADYASVFPAGLSVAASWDVDLAYQRGVAMGSEFRDKGANIALG